MNCPTCFKAFTFAAIFLGLAGTGHGEATIRIFENGDDVLMTGNGTLNVDDLFFVRSEPFNGGAFNRGSVLVGETSPSPFGTRFYFGEISQPSKPYWNPSHEFISPDFDKDFGPMFGLQRDASVARNRDNVMDLLEPCISYPAPLCFPVAVSLPGDYESGELLRSKSVIPDTSIGVLGLNPGEYLFSWGSGVNADSLTLTIVPEPSFNPMHWMLILLVAFAHSRRKHARLQNGSELRFLACRFEWDS